MSGVTRAAEGRTLLAVDLALEPAPALPRAEASEVTSGVELCGEQLQLFTECILERQSDDFCQESLLLFAICKERRDAALRARIKEYDRVHGTEPALLAHEALEFERVLEHEQQKQLHGESLGSVHLARRLQDLRERIKALSGGTDEPTEPSVPG